MFRPELRKNARIVKVIVCATESVTPPKNTIYDYFAVANSCISRLRILVHDSNLDRYSRATRRQQRVDNAARCFDFQTQPRTINGAVDGASTHTKETTRFLWKFENELIKIMSLVIKIMSNDESRSRSPRVRDRDREREKRREEKGREEDRRRKVARGFTPEGATERRGWGGGRGKGRVEALPTFTVGVPTWIRRYLPLHLRANLTATNRRPRSRKWVANRRIRIYCAIKRPSLRLPSRFHSLRTHPEGVRGSFQLFTRPDPRHATVNKFRTSFIIGCVSCKRKGNCRLKLIYLLHRETQTPFHPKFR